MQSPIKTITSVLLLATCFALINADYDRGSYNELESDFDMQEPILGKCISGSDCDARTQCSVMGMQRFSEPRCEPLGSLGSPCRMYNEPENKTLSFPFETKVCQEVYTQFCPCGAGLSCQEAECRPIAVQQSRPSVFNNNDADAIKTRRQKLMQRWGRLYQ